jgi:hypothetical protein
MSFTFSDLDGLMALDEPQLDDFPPHDSTLTAWSSMNGVTDSYLVVRDVPATLPAGSAEGDITMKPMTAPSGQAWLAVDNGVSDPPPSSATHIMWWRDDGRLWIISSYGMAPDQMTDLTFAIEQHGGGALTLAEPSMIPMGTSSLETSESLRQQWSLDGQPLDLVLSNGGLVEQLDLPVRSIVEHQIADRAGYKITLSNGQVNLAWPTDDPAWWGSVTSGPALAPRIDAVAAAIVPADTSSPN